MFKLEFKTDNAAFRDPSATYSELTIKRDSVVTHSPRRIYPASAVEAVALYLGDAAHEAARCAEIASILRSVAWHVEVSGTDGAVFDKNGNRVGEFSLED